MCLTVEQYWRFALLICVMKIIFCIGDESWHFLSNGEVESIAFDDLRFLNRFTIGLDEDIDGLDILGSLNNHLEEELRVCSNKF